MTPSFSPAGAGGGRGGGLGGRAAAGEGRGGAGIAGAITTALVTLKDLPGIAGSFVFNREGRVVAREIPAMFDDAALGDAAERLTRLSDTFASVGDELDLAVIRFLDHKLYLKVLSGGMLCILADGAVNMAALRMAANLVARRIVPALENEGAVGMDSQPGSGAAGTGAGGAPVGEKRFSAAAVPEASSKAISASTAIGFSGRPETLAPGRRRFRGRSLE